MPSDTSNFIMLVVNGTTCGCVDQHQALIYMILKSKINNILLTCLLREVAGTCECGNGPSVSIICAEFRDYLRIC